MSYELSFEATYFGYINLNILATEQYSHYCAIFQCRFAYGVISQNLFNLFIKIQAILMHIFATKMSWNFKLYGALAPDPPTHQHPTGA